MSTTPLTMPPDRELVATRVFDAPRRLVWDAWTNPKRVPQCYVNVLRDAMAVDLSEAVAMGKEPLLIVGAMAGG